MFSIPWKHAAASLALILCSAAPAWAQEAVHEEPPRAAAAAPTATAEPSQADARCFPSCRPGYLCREGQCISACEPACGAGEVCMESHECLPAAPATSAPPPAAPAQPPVAPTPLLEQVEQAPPLKGPGELLVMPTLGGGWYGFGGFSVGLGLGFGGERRWFYLEPSFRYGRDSFYDYFSIGALIGFRGMNGSGRVRYSQSAGVDVRFTSVNFDGLSDPYRDYLELIPTYSGGIAIVGETVTHLLEVVVGHSFVFSLGSGSSTSGVGSHMDLYLRWGIAF